MPAYKYEAMNSAGEICRGLVEADSIRFARQSIAQKGLLLIEIVPVSRGFSGRFTWLSPVLSQADKVLFARQFCILLSAGLSIESALQALSEEAEKKYFQSLMILLRTDILEGVSLADAMSKHGKDFPSFICMLVRAGEMSGRLPEIMASLADYLENKQLLSQKVIGSLVYPVIVTIFSVLVIVLMMVYVVPQVIGVFLHTKRQLPLLTRSLIALSSFFKKDGLYFLGALGTSVLFWRKWLKKKKNVLKFHSFLLKVPIVGRLISSLDSARFSSTLAILLKGGVPLLHALSLSGNVIRNHGLKRVINGAEILVQEGSSLARALSVDNVFPSILIHLIANGEKTGELAVLLSKASHILQRDAERRLMFFVSLLEPLLILFTGGIVLMIVLAILMPIFDMNTLIH